MHACRSTLEDPTCAEIAGAIALLVPKTMRVGAALLTLVLLGAMVTHVTHGQGTQVLRPLVYLAVLGIAFWLRPRPAPAGTP